MSRVVRERVEPKKLVLKRYRGDKSYIIAGSETEIKHGQVMAMKSTDGKLYAYSEEGTEGLNIPIGVYTGVSKKSTNDFGGSITTFADVSKTEVIGINFETNFTAVIELQKMGTYVIEEIEGKEVNE